MKSNDPFEETSVQEEKSRTEGSFGFYVSLGYDLKYWSTGHLSVNMYTSSIEIEFLCFELIISTTG